MMFRQYTMLLIPLLLGILVVSGCDQSKVVSVSRQKQASAPMMTGDEYGVDAYPGRDLLVIRFDTDYSFDDMPIFLPLTLTTAKGKECKERGSTRDRKEMGSTVEVWFDIPEDQTLFILKFDSKSFPIDTSKPPR